MLMLGGKGLRPVFMLFNFICCGKLGKLLNQKIRSHSKVFFPGVELLLITFRKSNKKKMKGNTVFRSPNISDIEWI